MHTLFALFDGRRTSGFVLSLLFLGAFQLPGEAMAGQSTAASIVGQVRDEGGGVLPGVTVTAKSPALQVPEVASVTDERGEYRLTPLPIGTYTVEYALPGFQTHRQEAVRLTVGFVAKVNVVLIVGQLTESVTVSGVSPVVDASATAATTEFTRETLELIPTSRAGITTLLAQTPGVRTNFDVGGSGMMGTPQFRAMGQSQESWHTLEGVFTASPKDTQSSNYYDYATLEEARVQTIANNAEVPRRGVAVNGIVKSGGNAFHGGVFWAQTNDRFQSDNVDDALRARGIQGAANIETRWDVSGDLGGKIVHNKLWFYGAYRQRRSVSQILDAFKEDGTPALNIQRQKYVTGKLSYQISPGNRLVGFYQGMTKHWVSGASRFRPWETRTIEPTKPDMGKVEWQGLRNSLVATLQYGYWQGRTTYPNFGSENSQNVQTFDIRTLMHSGAPAQNGNEPLDWRHHTTGSLSWYRPDLFLGNHELKTGFDYMPAGIRRWHYSRVARNYRLIFDNGVPFQVETFNYPVRPMNLQKYIGVYMSDAWTIGRLTLNLGVRFARDNGFVPAQCREAGDFAVAECYPKVQTKIWNSVAPRLFAAYDLGGNGKTAIKGGWGRFDHMREISPEVDSLNRHVASSATWRWRDLNSNRDYDPGEVNLDPNGGDFISITGGFLGGGSDTVVNPDEKQPKADQFSLSLERELMPNFAVRITGAYTRNFNTSRIMGIDRPYDVYNIPITNPDPGADGQVGTADDPGTFVTYNDFPASLSGRQFARTMMINPPGNEHTYKTIELAANKRLSNRWQLMASYSATKNHVPFGSEYVEHNPNAEINLADDTWEWLAKGSTAFMFPADIIVSANFEHRSGNPQAREVLFRGGRQIPSIVLRVEPIGSLRLPNTNILDLRAEKRFRFTGSQSVSVRLNVFNALNVNTVTSWTVRSGPNFLVPTAIVPPRILEFSATYSF
jgi:hypothetical protein